MVKKLILASVILGAFVVGALQSNSGHNNADILPKIIYTEGLNEL